jgi:hypothetical protein
MRRDVLRRVRWANVALTAAVLLALTTLVVWPLLSPSTPTLPPDTSRPLVDDAHGATNPTGAGEAKPGDPAHERRKPGGAKRAGDTGRAKRGGTKRGDRSDGTSHGGAKRGGAKHPARPRRPAERVPPTPTATPPPTAAPSPHRPVTPSRSPAGGEFGFEGGH